MPGWNFVEIFKNKKLTNNEKRQGTVVCLKKDGLNSLNIEPREHHRQPREIHFLAEMRFGRSYASKLTTAFGGLANSIQGKALI